MRLELVSLLPARRSQLALARQGSRLLHLFRVPGRHKLSRDMKPLQKVLRPTEVSDVTDGTVDPMFILGAGSHEPILLLCQRTRSVAKWCNLNLKVCALCYRASERQLRPRDVRLERSLATCPIIHPPNRTRLRFLVLSSSNPSPHLKSPTPKDICITEPRCFKLSRQQRAQHLASRPVLGPCIAGAAVAVAVFLTFYTFPYHSSVLECPYPLFHFPFLLAIGRRMTSLPLLAHSIRVYNPPHLARPGHWCHAIIDQSLPLYTRYESASLPRLRLH
jgi:hypothetical protein